MYNMRNKGNTTHRYEEARRRLSLIRKSHTEHLCFSLVDFVVNGLSLPSNIWTKVPGSDKDPRTGLLGDILQAKCLS